MQICTYICDDESPVVFNPVNFKGLYKKFFSILRKIEKVSGTSNEIKFLAKAVDKMVSVSKINKDKVINDLITSTLGTIYPDPPRVLNFVEPCLAEFFDKNVYKSIKKLDMSIFPTEGAANAIIYLLNTLKYNGLVIPGDKVGILTPIFTPYLELPILRNYDFEQICVKANSKTGEIPICEMSKIADPDMRILLLVNPTNPTSLVLSDKTIRKMAAIIRKKNPSLIVITDNVYAQFSKKFNTLFNALPRNTIGIYSFSKYFGATGCRLGTIIIHDSNIIDSKLLKEAPDSVNSRYKLLSLKPQNIKFIDRVLADSRQVAETHIAGLSTPQQVQMTLFALYDLLDNTYHDSIISILKNRLDKLTDELDYKITNLNYSPYYVMLDITHIATKTYGDLEFTMFLKNHKDPLEFLVRLAKGYGIVLLPGVGFAGSFWSVRVSLANLYSQDYTEIGKSIIVLLGEYYHEFTENYPTNECSE